MPKFIIKSFYYLSFCINLLICLLDICLLTAEEFGVEEGGNKKNRQSYEFG